jgi:putative tryptophan/tyrosine transport system substrate-binding protein
MPKMPRMTIRRALLGAALAAPFVGARGQRSIQRVSWLSSNPRARSERRLEAFLAGMKELGWEQGRDFTLEAAWDASSPEVLARHLAQLTQSPPDLIVSQGASVLALVRAGLRTPVVFAFSGDPVAARIVDSLQHPGRNFTGITLLALDLVGKRMELLKELSPAIRSVAVIANPAHAGVEAEREASLTAARKLGLAVQYHAVRSAAELDAVLSHAQASHAESIELFPDNRTMEYSERIAEFARRQRAPSISGWSDFAERGNSLAYGPIFTEVFRRLARHADRILKGAKPSEVAVELPTRVELVVNVKAVQGLGLRVPPALLARADRLID